MKRFILVIVGLLVAGSILVAQTKATPHAAKRQKKQERRIEQGKRSGVLTHDESKTLEKRETKVKKDKAKAKSDGVVTKQEHHKLKREQKNISRAIYRKKHNERKQI
jgi:hypothetical protein